MTVYVVDATIVMHYLIADSHTINARAFFRGITRQDRLIVPEFPPIIGAFLLGLRLAGVSADEDVIARIRATLGNVSDPAPKRNFLSARHAHREMESQS